ncbi:DNA polymerase III subunit beta [Sutcliffiella sp. NPDC057660]|uniref:DNA polymerase III subunit beta n=1 Tax=Sutcliffiella sp. NPDC057660 TaxID=3346199 RepID=UPI00369FEE7F
MKFSIKRDLLMEGLNRVIKVVNQKHSIPILQGILFELTADKLTITGSDSTETIRHIIDADGDGLLIESEGNMVFPKNIVEITKKLNKEIAFSQDGYNATIISGKSEFQIITLDAEEYPKFQSFDLNSPTVTYKGPEFRDLVRKTAFSAADSEIRPILTGVCIEVVQEDCTLVCTDSHRLSKISKRAKVNQDFKVVVPARSLETASKIFSDSDVDMYLSPQQLLLRNGSTLYLSRLLDGNYPDTSRLIPTDYQNKLTIDRKEFIDGLEMLKGLSLSADDNKGGIVKLHINGAANLSTNQTQRGKGKVDVPYTSYEGEEDFTISFSIKYAQEALKSIDKEKVDIFFQGQLRPFVIQPTEVTEELQLILPVRTV